MNRKVDFIIGGAPRCGTSLIAKVLNEHPDIFLAFSEQEYAGGDLHFFDVENEEGQISFAKGIDWYHKNFETAKPGQILGEKTADYLFSEEACELIHDYRKDMKLIFILRNPVFRAWSHFKHSRHKYTNYSSFDAFLDQEIDELVSHNVLKNGFYCNRISKYIEEYGSQNVKVLIMEELERDYVGSFKEICKFLGANSEYRFEGFRDHVNASSDSGASVQIARLGRYIRRKHSYIYNALHYKWVAPIIRALVLRLRNKEPKVFDPEGDKDAISTGSAIKLSRLYRSDVEKLGALLGKDLISIWQFKDR